jgi:hypothetical protein
MGVRNTIACCPSGAPRGPWPVVRLPSVSLAALIIAIAGLVLAGMSLGWQIAAWNLTGGRVRVTLKHGAMTGAMAITRAIGQDGALATPADLRLDPGSGATEVLAVDVRNVGRMPVTIERFGAELLQPRNGSLLSMLLPQRGALSLIPVADAIGRPMPHRMEPGTAETWYVRMHEVRALVYSAQAINPGGRSVAMFVELGNGRKVRTRHSASVPTGG